MRLGVLLGVASVSAPVENAMTFIPARAFAFWTRDGKAPAEGARLYLDCIAAAIIAPIVLERPKRLATLCIRPTTHLRTRFPPRRSVGFVTRHVRGSTVLFARCWFIGQLLRDPQPVHSLSRGLLLAFTSCTAADDDRLLSRAHANWPPLPMSPHRAHHGVLLRQGWHRVFRGSMALHLAVVLACRHWRHLADTSPCRWRRAFDRYSPGRRSRTAGQGRAGGFAAIATDRGLARTCFTPP